MRCGKAQRLLPLLRPGELDDTTQKRLFDHLERCPRCAAEHAKALSMERSLDALRRVAPVNAEASALTHAIMRQIEGAATAEGRPRIPVVPRQPLLHWIRIVSYASAWMIAGAFFLLSYSDAKRMESMEGRMRRSAVLRTEQGIVQQLDGIETRRAEAGTVDFKAALAFLRSSSLGSTPEMERLRTKYPALWSLSLDHGLDTTARRILATEGKSFLKDVQDLVNLGDR